MFGAGRPWGAISPQPHLPARFPLLPTEMSLLLPTVYPPPGTIPRWHHLLNQNAQHDLQPWPMAETLGAPRLDVTKTINRIAAQKKLSRPPRGPQRRDGGSGGTKALMVLG